MEGRRRRRRRRRGHHRRRDRSQVWDAGTRSVVSGGADVSELEASVIRSMGMERGLVKFFFFSSHIVGEEEELRRNTSLFSLPPLLLSPPPRKTKVEPRTIV